MVHNMSLQPLQPTYNLQPQPIGVQLLQHVQRVTDTPEQKSVTLTALAMDTIGMKGEGVPTSYSSCVS